MLEKHKNRIQLFALLTLILCAHSLCGQELSREFAKVTMADMECCEDLTDEKAIILFDLGETKYVTDENYNGFGFDLETQHTKRIKVNSSGASDLANISFWMNRKGLERMDIEAYAYNLEEGRIMRTSLDKEQIFIEDIDQYTVRVKFAVPNVKEGTVFEYRYRTKSESIIQSSSTSMFDFL